VQQPHPPIHFGGESDAALRRVADVGQGWYGFGLDPEATAERVGRLASMLSKRGRRREEIAVSVCPYMRETTSEDVEAYARAGVDRLILVAAARDAAALERALDAMGSVRERAGAL
jgi:alkanesulfonate monooxygenase SsuD/methylene tetrahydromethanopterin reductase-like flavin-dependent oxidoreductase (luciferase family)